MKKSTLFILGVAFSHSLAFSQGCLPEGITFTTQEQIDNFQANYPGCTEIEGDVIINGWISNLNGLNMLTSIGGNLEIFNPGELLTTLAGFDALTAVNGNLTIAGTSLVNLSGLGSLNFIGGNLTLGFGGQINPLLSSLSGLEALTTIGGALNLYANYSLSSLSGLEALTTIGGALNLDANNSLSNLIGLNALASVNGLYFNENINLSSLAGIENINVASVNYIRISGNTSLSSCNVQIICDYLLAPNGPVDIYGNDTGCNNPTEVAEGCNITLPCLPFGNYWFHSQSDIDNFQGNHPGCTQLEGSVYVIGSDITNLNGLNTVTSIRGGLIIGHEWLGGGNPLLENLEGLENIDSIGGTLHIQYNILLENLSGLQNLTSIGGNLQLIGNHAVYNLSGLENLASIGLGLEISGNNGLTNLTGLENVKNAGGYILIRLNDELTSLSGLDNIDSGSINELSIYFNDNLSDCDIQSICEYLANPTGTIEISGNAEGCNSPEEVQAACDEVSIESLGFENDYLLFPNPADKTITISGNNFTAIREIVIYNQTGQKVQQSKPVNNNLDISKLRPGMYIVELVTNQGMLRKKLMVE